MRPHLLLAIGSLVLYLSGTSLADECVPSTANPEVDTGETIFGRHYIDNDLCQVDDEEPCLFSIWQYQESNGIDGLQRSDEVVDNTCGGMIDGDVTICGLLPIGMLTRRREDARAGRGAAVAGAALVGLAAAGALVPTAEAC